MVRGAAFFVWGVWFFNGSATFLEGGAWVYGIFMRGGRERYGVLRFNPRGQIGGSTGDEW